MKAEVHVFSMFIDIILVVKCQYLVSIEGSSKIST